MCSGMVSPQPPTGNQPRFTAKMRMRTSPTQKDGMPRPTSGTTRITWSVGRSLRIAAMVASGTAISTLKSVAKATSDIVTPMRLTISVRVGTS